MLLKKYNFIFRKNSTNFVLSEKFVNNLMSKGKKSISEKIIFNIFKILQKTTVKNIIYLIKFSVINSSIVLCTFKIKKKKKGVVREIPFILSLQKRTFSIIKVILNFIKFKLKSSFLINFKNEIIKILKKNSDLLLKKEQIFLSVLKNKAYAHFRWF
jgi:small subunit ribosomal protein S7